MLDLLAFGQNGWGDELLFGTLTSIAIGISSYVFGLFVGLWFALLKIRGGKIAQHFATTYTTVIRGVPELIIIYLFFFGGTTMIATLASIFGYNGYIELPPFLIGVIAIGLVSGAYSCEVIRGSIQSLSKGQLEAGLSLGLDENTIYKKIILPQALKHSIVPLGNVWQLTIKDTALVSVTGIFELMRVARTASNSEREPFLFFIIATIVFLGLTALSTHVQNKIESRSEFNNNNGNTR